MDIIGISGPPCSGKDIAAEYLSKQYGYDRISTGDLLRARARELCIDLGRSSLQLLGARLREENGGNDPLLESVLKNITNNTVFTGIRTLGAAEMITATEIGRIVYVETPLETRYKRSALRNREDHVSFDEFVVQDRIEHGGSEQIDTSLLSIKAIASTIIVNNSSLDDYLSQIDDIIPNTERDSRS